MDRLGFPGNTKQGEQYKNYKAFTHIQTFHTDRSEGIKITV